MIERSINRTRAALFVFGTLAILGGLCVTAVPETSQAVVTRMGEPVRVVNRWSAGNPSGGGGLLVHLPLIEQVQWVERGLFGFSAERMPVRGSDNFPLLVDATVTVRAFDPVRLVESAGTTERAITQLSDATRSLAQQELGNVDSQRMIGPGSGGGAARLRAALDARARPLGLQVVDLRLSSTALPEGELQQAYERMEAERDRLAAIEADQGARQAQEIALNAKTEAARILGATAGRDPEFYDFYRAMLSYELVFANPQAKGNATIILGPDSEYLKQFRGR